MTLQFPDTLTPELDEILGTMIMDTTRIAHMFRETGSDIPRKVEKEHAHVLFWMLRLFLEHGPGEWRKVAGRHLGERLERAKAQRSIAAFPGGRPDIPEASIIKLRELVSEGPQPFVPFLQQVETLIRCNLAEVALGATQDDGIDKLRATALGETWIRTEPKAA